MLAVRETNESGTLITKYYKSGHLRAIIIGNIVILVVPFSKKRYESFGDIYVQAVNNSGQKIRMQKAWHKYIT